MYTSRWLVVATILLLLSVLFLGWYSYNLTTQLSALSQNAYNLSQELAILSKQQASLTKDVTNLQADVAAANNKLDTLTNKLETLIAETSGTIINIPKLYNQVKEGVIQVRAVRDGGRSVGGSGFIFDSQGYLTTNHHVVENAQDIEVTLYDRTIHKVTTVGSDAYSDIAVLKLSNFAGQALTMADSDKVNIGDNVIAIGSPFGLGGTVTSGIVSQKKRLLPSVGGFSIANVIQFDAAVNPGNSGGPLLNSKGEVIGITSARIESPRGAVGLGFAISSNTIKKVASALIQRGSYQHPYLGITVVNITPKIAEAMNLPTAKGVLITEVKADSPAASAGLRAGDKSIEIDGKKITIGGDIIIAIDEVPVTDMNDLLSYLSEHKSPRQTVTLTIVRNSKELRVTFILGTRPLP